MGGFWEGFEGDLIGFWAVAAELLAVACFYLLLLTFACFGCAFRSIAAQVSFVYWGIFLLRCLHYSPKDNFGKILILAVALFSK